MNIDDVIAHFGSASELARQLGCSRQAVQLMQKRGGLPLGRQYQIEVLTGGKFQAPRPHTSAA